MLAVDTLHARAAYPAPAHNATPNVLGTPVLLPSPVRALPFAEPGRLPLLNNELLLLAAGAVDGLLLLPMLL
jgi:hypothetical protein